MLNTDNLVDALMIRALSVFIFISMATAATADPLLKGAVATNLTQLPPDQPTLRDLFTTQIADLRNELAAEQANQNQNIDRIRQFIVGLQAQIQGINDRVTLIDGINVKLHDLSDIVEKNADRLTVMETTIIPSFHDSQLLITKLEQRVTMIESSTVGANWAFQFIGFIIGSVSAGAGIYVAMRSQFVKKLLG